MKFTKMTKEKELINWFIQIINSWLINKHEKGNVRDQGWNNALLNMKKVLIDKLAGEYENGKRKTKK